MTDNQKRAQLKNKIDAAEKRNQERSEQQSLGEYARSARDGATSFVKEHPITTLAGAAAVGILIASFVPGPGRRLRKKATERGAVLAGVLADLAITYGSQALEGAGNAARSGQDKLGDLADDAGSLTREAGKRASRTLRDLRSRMAH